MIVSMLIQLSLLVIVLISSLNLSFGFTRTTTTVGFPRKERFVTKAIPTITRPQSKLYYANDDGRRPRDNKENNHNDRDGDGYDEDEIIQTPYRNRSLAWTNNYRKLFPYESARRHAIGLGLSTKEEWYRAGAGRPYMIKCPDKMYQEEWISWDEFLGTMRPYHETKQLVQMVLQIKTMDDYILFVRSDSLRAAGLRIPVRPDLYYKADWEGPEDFFGTTN